MNHGKIDFLHRFSRQVQFPVQRIFPTENVRSWGIFIIFYIFTKIPPKTDMAKGKKRLNFLQTENDFPVKGTTTKVFDRGIFFLKCEKLSI